MIPFIAFLTKWYTIYSVQSYKIRKPYYRKQADLIPRNPLPHKSEKIKHEMYDHTISEIRELYNYIIS